MIELVRVGSAGSVWFQGFGACAGREGLLGLGLVVGLGEALRCRMLGLRCENIGTNRNSGCLPLLRISGDLSDLCSL